MPRNETVLIPKDTWTQLTANDVTAITFQIKRGVVEIAVAVGAVAPTNFDDAITYHAREGEMARPIAEMAPGIAGTRVYAYSAGEGASVYVSHA